jgi:hypothetical protein
MLRLVRKQANYMSAGRAVQSPVSIALENMVQGRAPEVSQEVRTRLEALNRSVERIGASPGVDLDTIRSAVMSAVQEGLESFGWRKSPSTRDRSRSLHRGRGEYSVVEFLEREEKDRSVSK